jgi:hypothetical protein
MNWFRTGAGGGLVNTTVKLKTLPLEVKVKAKESRNRPGEAQRVPRGLGSQIT